MKIIGGKFKGRNFYMPKDTRPTPDVVRRAVFDILGQDLTGVDFLDLFAGSGAVGLEALSRNARRVVFVEKNARCCEIIHENLATIGAGGWAESAQHPTVLNTDAFAAVKQFSTGPRRFDVAFADPPYYHGLGKKALKTLVDYDIVQPVSYILVQHDKRDILPEKEGRFFIVRQRRYGGSLLSLYTSQDT